VTNMSPDIVFLSDPFEVAPLGREIGRLAEERPVVLAIDAPNPAIALAAMRAGGMDRSSIQRLTVGLLCQRLFRKLCQECKRPIQLSSRLMDLLGISHELLGTDSTIWEPGDCPQCQKLGYKGRVPLFSLLEAEALETMLASAPENDDWSKWPEGKDRNPLQEGALNLMLLGLTSLEEFQKSHL